VPKLRQSTGPSWPVGGNWAKLAGLAGALADFGYYAFAKGRWKVEGCQCRGDLLDLLE
jgi:hypothetical protein